MTNTINCAKIWNPDFYFKKEPGYEEMKRELVKLLQGANLVPTNIELSTFGSTIAYNDRNIKLLRDAMIYNLNLLLKRINNALYVENVRCYYGKITFDIAGYEYLKVD